MTVNNKTLAELGQKEDEKGALKSSEINLRAAADAGKENFDFYIVYQQHQKTTQAQKNLRGAMEEEIPGVSIWPEHSVGDVEYEEGIRESRNIVLLLSSDFTANEVILSQMRLAQSLRKPVIRVLETLKPYHAPNFQKLIDDCPDDLKAMLADQSTCIEMSHGKGKNAMAAQIRDASKKRNIISENTGGRRSSLGGLIYEHGEECMQVFDVTLVAFCALCGVCLPGAGTLTKKWSLAVWAILSICALMCLSRFGTTVGPAFLDYATITQISVDHPALVLFLFVSYKMVRSEDVLNLVGYHINCTPMMQFLKCKQKVAVGLSAVLTVSLVLFGWVGYLPGFFNEYYLTHSSGSMVIFGLAHGLIWIVILPIFFGSLFAALLIMFVVQELAYCCVISSFSVLHPDIALKGLHVVCAGNQELTISQVEFTKFKDKYLAAWERNKNIQRFGALPFMVFWFLQFCIMSWSIWSITQGFSADYDDSRVPRLEEYWNLVARLLFFMVHSLWFGAGALIVGFLPFGVNYYGWRMRQLCHRLNIKEAKEANIKQEIMALLKGHDLNFRVGLLWTPLWTLPIYTLIVSVNIVGFNADAARILGAYEPP